MTKCSACDKTIWPWGNIGEVENITHSKGVTTKQKSKYHKRCLDHD